jgi:hypothetical protein
MFLSPMSDKTNTPTMIRVRPVSRLKADAIVAANPGWTLAQAVDAALSDYIVRNGIKARLIKPSPGRKVIGTGRKEEASRAA